MEERHNNKNCKSLNLTRQLVEILIKCKDNLVIQKVVKLPGTPTKLTEERMQYTAQNIRIEH